MKPRVFVLCGLIFIVLDLLALYVDRERNFISNCMQAKIVITGANNTREFCEELRRTR